MYQFSITNIDDPEAGINVDSLNAFFRLKEHDNISLKDERMLITHDCHAVSLHMIKTALQYQSQDRFLVEYLGTSRHVKIVYKNNDVLAWASYDRLDLPVDLSELALPLQTNFGEKVNAKCCISTAYVRGKTSGKDITVKRPVRDELVNLAKYGSWFNEEEVTLEFVKNDRFDAMRFINGKIKEKRGINYHYDYKDTLEWLGFDERVAFKN